MNYSTITFMIPHNFTKKRIEVFCICFPPYHTLNLHSMRVHSRTYMVILKNTTIINIAPIRIYIYITLVHCIIYVTCIYSRVAQKTFLVSYFYKIKWLGCLEYEICCQTFFPIKFFAILPKFVFFKHDMPCWDR